MKRYLIMSLIIGIGSVVLGKPIHGDIAAKWSGFREATSLPYDAEVEYLLSTGKEWIDTGIVPGMDFYIRCTAMFTKDPGSAIFSTEEKSGPYIDWYRPGQIRLYGTSSILNKSVGEFLTGEVDFAFSASPSTIIRIGSSVCSGSTTYTEERILAANNTVTLFRGIYNKTNAVAIASFYMEKDDEPVIDLVPVRMTNERGYQEGALFDRVSGALFRNQGKGSFIIGPDL